VSAEIQIVAALGFNLSAITTALSAAEAQIIASTTGAAGGLAATATGLLQADINTLTNDINQAIALINGIQATLTVTATNLAPGKFCSLETEIYSRGYDETNESIVAYLAVASELAAVQAALAPFVGPLALFASAASQASASAGVTVTGLNAAVRGLVGLVMPTVMGATGV
jgi:hypothetical protein